MPVVQQGENCRRKGRGESLRAAWRNVTFSARRDGLRFTGMKKACPSILKNTLLRSEPCPVCSGVSRLPFSARHTVRAFSLHDGGCV